SNIQADIQQTFGGSGNKVQGYMLPVSWAAMETSQNTYSWTLIDNVRSYIAANYPGKRFALLLYTNNYFGAACGDYIPNYILTTSTYGSSTNTDTGGGNY